MKLCECGCGQPTKLADATQRKYGWVKGQPRRFLKGHWMKGRPAENRLKYRRVRVGGVSRPAHVVIAERALGRLMPVGAEVHHVDCDRHHNANTNLVICQDTAYHRLLHVRAKVVRAGGNPNTQQLCRDCRQVKAFGEFHRNTQNKAFGTTTICKQCQAGRDSIRNKRLSNEARLAR